MLLSVEPRVCPCVNRNLELGMWIDGYLLSLGFNKSVAYPNLYYKFVNGQSFILVLYIADLFFTREESLIARCKYELAFEFEIKELGIMHYFLGL
jgi:hypothetical protein